MFKGSMIRSGFVMAFAAATLGTMGFHAGVAPLEAQAQAVQDARSERDPMEVVARMFIEISEIRDELHQELARYHEVYRREEVRSEASERLGAVYQRHGVAERDYDAFIAWVSADESAREAFEAMLEAIREGTD